MGDIRDFIERHYAHFNAGELARCVAALDRFLAGGGKLVVTLAGAMSTAEIGRSLAAAIRAGKVHAISCTGANLEEDVFNLVARDKYQKVSDWRGLTAADDRALHDRGFNRVTDTCIPEEAAIRLLEGHLRTRWQQGEAAFPHEHLYAILDALDPVIDPADSWLLAARDAGIPIWTPGWEDSTLGNLFAAACIRGEAEPTTVKSGTEAMLDLAAWYASMSTGADPAPLGLLQVGGGIAGDFPICVVPMLRQDLERTVPLWSWFGQISDATTSYGGYSGAPPNEKISWGKLAMDTPRFMIESDATIVLPLILAAICE